MKDAPRRNNIPQVTTILAKTKGSICVVRRLASTRRGTGCHTLLQVHNALVLSCICYVAPYLHASKSLRSSLSGSTTPV